ncbi:MAG: TetR/AcrR family transcriptional regulator [Mesorhizobium sp.]|nr:MAG: TetR/AcrR family transcriptional regulator [Mesorhizobium sp.]
MTENQPKKPSKSDRTRAQILKAARLLFAEHGYDGASIRDVAAHASIDPAMVIRYFRSKDELFARAAVIDLQLPALRVLDRNAVGETLIRRFLEIWESPASGPGMAILLRSATSNEFAAEKLRDVFGNQVRPVVAAVADPACGFSVENLFTTQHVGVNKRGNFRQR